ncbi:Uncharacterized protein PECH_008395 [Penicillium ucsense]|uniref:Copper transport protein n=1 Tax=Penicillium ucsense TaxID=2839758 RepID=A0A8J8WAG6_9EURO|nr:Uncharacterized protein PECM_002068 [Penicillium ucsense]KAF7734219.1 Uncharacterized protein PECH_008395 [Penicillium ucsense]
MASFSSMSMPDLPAMTAMPSGLGVMNTSSMGMPDMPLNGSAPPTMPGMDGMDLSCRISMLWNWFTIDACFLSSTWHIRSKGAFAGSCIGVILLVISLEFLRRLGREFDAFILRRARQRQSTVNGAPYKGQTTGYIKPGMSPDGSDPDCVCAGPTSSSIGQDGTKLMGSGAVTAVSSGGLRSTENGSASRQSHEAVISYRPSPLEQIIRALLHTVQFAVAYIIMLLAMYFNGYIIICIFIGAFLGALIFSWQPLSLSHENDATQVTKCCG